MIRTLATIVVALTMSGCAVDSEDPIPAPAQKQPQRDPPAEKLRAQLETPDEGSNPFEDQNKERPEDLWGFLPAPAAVQGKAPSN